MKFSPSINLEEYIQIKSKNFKMLHSVLWKHKLKTIKLEVKVEEDLKKMKYF